MKRECLHPSEIPVEVEPKIPLGEKIALGIMGCILLGALGMLFVVTHDYAYHKGQQYGEEAYSDPLKVELDPPIIYYRNLTIIDGDPGDISGYINYSYPVNRF